MEGSRNKARNVSRSRLEVSFFFLISVCYNETLKCFKLDSDMCCIAE